MEKEISQKDIEIAIISNFSEDKKFIRKINNLTYSIIKEYED